MWSGWLEYNVTRHFTLKYLSIILLGSGFFWASLTTILTTAAVSYDTLQVYLDTFDPPDRLWYERIFPQSNWFPKSTICEGSTIAAGEGGGYLNKVD